MSALAAAIGALAVLLCPSALATAGIPTDVLGSEYRTQTSFERSPWATDSAIGRVVAQPADPVTAAGSIARRQAPTPSSVPAQQPQPTSSTDRLPAVAVILGAAVLLSVAISAVLVATGRIR